MSDTSGDRIRRRGSGNDSDSGSASASSLQAASAAPVAAAAAPGLGLPRRGSHAAAATTPTTPRMATATTTTSPRGSIFALIGHALRRGSLTGGGGEESAERSQTSSGGGGGGGDDRGGRGSGGALHGGAFGCSPSPSARSLAARATPRHSAHLRVQLEVQRRASASTSASAAAAAMQTVHASGGALSLERAMLLQQLAPNADSPAGTPTPLARVTPRASLSPSPSPSHSPPLPAPLELPPAPLVLRQRANSVSVEPAAVAITTAASASATTSAASSPRPTLARAHTVSAATSSPSFSPARPSARVLHPARRGVGAPVPFFSPHMHAARTRDLLGVAAGSASPRRGSGSGGGGNSGRASPAASGVFAFPAVGSGASGGAGVNAANSDSSAARTPRTPLSFRAVVRSVVPLLNSRRHYATMSPRTAPSPSPGHGPSDGASSSSSATTLSPPFNHDSATRTLSPRSSSHRPLHQQLQQQQLAMLHAAAAPLDSVTPSSSSSGASAAAHETAAGTTAAAASAADSTAPAHSQRPSGQSTSFVALQLPPMTARRGRKAAAVPSEQGGSGADAPSSSSAIDAAAAASQPSAENGASAQSQAQGHTSLPFAFGGHHNDPYSVIAEESYAPSSLGSLTSPSPEEAPTAGTVTGTDTRTTTTTGVTQADRRPSPAGPNPAQYFEDHSRLPVNAAALAASAPAAAGSSPTGAAGATAPSRSCAIAARPSNSGISGTGGGGGGSSRGADPISPRLLSVGWGPSTHSFRDRDDHGGSLSLGVAAAHSVNSPMSPKTNSSGWGGGGFGSLTGFPRGGGGGGGGGCSALTDDLGSAISADSGPVGGRGRTNRFNSGGLSALGGFSVLGGGPNHSELDADTRGGGGAAALASHNEGPQRDSRLDEPATSVRFGDEAARADGGRGGGGGETRAGDGAGTARAASPRRPRGSGARRLSDDYSTYKQRQLALAQQRLLQRKRAAHTAGLFSDIASARPTGGGGFRSGPHGASGRGGGGGGGAAPSPWFLIHPSSRFIRLWRWALLTAVWFAAFQAGLVVAFGLVLSVPPGPGQKLPALAVLNVLVDLLMLADMAVHACTGVLDDTLELQTDGATIRRAYARSWLWVDLLAAPPLDLVQAALIAQHGVHGPGAAVVHSFAFQLCKLGRIFKLAKVIPYATTRATMAINETVRAFFAFMSLLLLAHLVACGWWLVARLESAWDGEAYTWARQSGLDSDSGAGHSRLLEQYFTSLYWSLATLISIGFGGFSSATIAPERLYTLCVVLFASLAYAQVVGTFMLVVENLSRADRAHQTLCHALEAHMRRHAFPPGLRARVLAYQHSVRNYLDAHVGPQVFLRQEEEERFAAGAAARARDVREHFRNLEARHLAEREQRWEEHRRADQAHRDDPTAFPAPPPLPPELEHPDLTGAPKQPGSVAWLLECASHLDELREDTAATPVACAGSSAFGGGSGGGGGGGGGGNGGGGGGAAGALPHMRSEDKILSTLPQSYALELHLHLHGALVHSVPLLRDLPSSVLSAITQALRVGLWVRGDFIAKARGAGAAGSGSASASGMGGGFGGRAMYILKRGKIQEAQWSDLAKRVALAQRDLRLEQEQAAKAAALRAEQQKQREKGARDQRGEHKSLPFGAAGAAKAAAGARRLSLRDGYGAEAKRAPHTAAEGKVADSAGQGDSRSLPSFPAASSPSLSSRMDSRAAGVGAGFVQPQSQAQAHLSPHAALLASPLASHALARPSLRTHGPGFHFGEETLVRPSGTHFRDVRVVSAVAEVAVLDLAAFLRVCETFPSFARCICGEVERRERSMASRREKEARTIAEIEANRNSKAKAATRNRANVAHAASPTQDQRSLPLDSSAAAGAGVAAAPTGVSTPSSASGRVIAGAPVTPSGPVRARLSTSRAPLVDVAVE